MFRKQRITIALAGILSCTAIGPAMAQSDSKMSDMKMSHQQMMDKMNGMSADDKAAMFDKMSEKDKMSAMKMGGHDMGKMSKESQMDMMGKMSMQEKADMFDKMPMQKKMSMMQDMDKMNHDKMK